MRVNGNIPLSCIAAYWLLNFFVLATGIFFSATLVRTAPPSFLHNFKLKVFNLGWRWAPRPNQWRTTAWRQGFMICKNPYWTRRIKKKLMSSKSKPNEFHQVNATSLLNRQQDQWRPARPQTESTAQQADYSKVTAKMESSCKHQNMIRRRLSVYCLQELLKSM